MMPLAAADIAIIAATCFLCALAIAGVTFVTLRVLRPAPLTVQLTVVAVSTVLSVALSVLAIAAEMYLSAHDLTVLVWVVAIACVFSILTAGALARVVRTSVRSLADAVQRIGTEAPVTVPRESPAEFAALTRELSEVSERVRAARDELEELDSARRKFFAWISHDLRTPLAALRVTAEGAEMSATEETRELAHTVNTHAQSMTRLVDDLFELSLLAAGQLTLHPEPLDLHDIMSDSVTELRTAAESHRVRVIAAGLSGQTVWADPRRFARIISNLLSNAIRHAPADSEILITATELANGHAVIGVLDHGSGVATADLERMFDIGWRDDRARTTRPDDTVTSSAGLGLAIARGLARAHGGDITAEHTPEGFRMNVTVPAAASLHR